MSGRYEIHLWKADVPYSMFGGECSGTEERWHALVWDGLKREEIKEFSGEDRREVLLDATAKRAELEQADKQDISPDEAMRFTRAFLDAFNSVNKSNDQMATAFAFADVLATTLQLAKRGQS